MRTAAIGAITFLAAFGQKQPTGTQTPIVSEVVSHVYKPVPLEPTDERVGQLKLPKGFQVEKFAVGLKNPRMIAVADDGSVYVTEPKPGQVTVLRDTNHDGRADGQEVAAKLASAHGIAIRENRVYVVTVKEIFAADREADGTLGLLRPIVRNLPDGGQHGNRTIAFGPDGMMYVSIGSTCNACDETNPEHAAIIRMKPDGSGREVFATGLRNTVGFGWHPVSGALWGMDHGVDWLGDEAPEEELNLLAQGADYGWPKQSGFGKPVPSQIEPAEKGSSADRELRARGPVLGYKAHAAPMQMVFYTGSQFPENYRNDAFVAMRGSWNSRPPVGYEVVRIQFENGRAAKFEPFLRGFLTEMGGGKWGQFGRPTGLAMMKDGSLLVSDDTNGVIYRISYKR
jgi:glucose/arabinose dehydrogenase